jgi:glyoxylase-like metal-dependent hydrolase (beta-lactamase superfamily II)
MAITRLASALVVLVALCSCSAPREPAQGPQAHAERLYVLDCGNGTAPDVSRWSPGVNVGQPVDFVDNCYLVKHAKGWLLWDTGVADAIAAMPDGLVPSDPRGLHWHRARTLAAQLEELQLKPADIRFVAISHSHPDHIGDLALFPMATLLVQRAEYEWPGPEGKPRFPPKPAADELGGDRDVFGDGSVTILATPGHTPGHQSLLVKLAGTGAVVLSGDAVHFQDNWDHRRVPGINFDKEQTLASMQRIADVLAREHAQLWINHDKAQRDRTRLSPQFYD